jgi:hypothetical protein
MPDKDDPLVNRAERAYRAGSDGAARGAMLARDRVRRLPSETPTFVTESGIRIAKPRSWGPCSIKVPSAGTSFVATTIRPFRDPVRAKSAGGLDEPSPAFELVRQIHAAAFALALPMIGATCNGLALAAHAGELTPAWQRLLGLVGGSLLLAAGLGNLVIADGSALIFVGLRRFAAWIVGCS